MAKSKLLYPCNFCTRLLSTKKKRTAHVKSCSTKEYIRSIPNKEQISPQRKKIKIHQDIIIERNPIFGFNKNQAPLKLAIQSNNDTNDFSVNNPVAIRAAVLKENNGATRGTDGEKPFPGFISTPKPEGDEPEAKKTAVCQQCDQDFATSLELLRHSRAIHSYPRIIMALSEVQKYYTIKDRSECPICHKPLRTHFKSAFIKHLQTHTNEALYSCMVCKQKFGRMDHMKAHEKRHVAGRKRERK